MRSSVREIGAARTTSWSAAFSVPDDDAREEPRPGEEEPEPAPRGHQIDDVGAVPGDIDGPHLLHVVGADEDRAEVAHDTDEDERYERADEARAKGRTGFSQDQPNPPGQAAFSSGSRRAWW